MEVRPHDRRDEPTDSVSILLVADPDRHVIHATHVLPAGVEERSIDIVEHRLTQEARRDASNGKAANL
jgi:hypothetical protein